MSSSDPTTLDVERVVSERYSAAAETREESLCCPVDYDDRLLAAIPAEVLERDYGCGDPSRWVRENDKVLDLGSGGGKICFIASQLVGPGGRVIGVDANPEMLALARGAAPQVGAALGFSNVEFLRGRIQDLALDLDLLDDWLAHNPVTNSAVLGPLEAEQARLRREEPLVRDASVDLVISNCVLNLVRPEDKTQMLREIARILRPGGRLAISDIVSDRPVPDALRADPELWSGCVSGAFEEQVLLRELAAAGLEAVTVAERATDPFAVVDGITFTSITVTAGEPADDSDPGCTPGRCC